MQTNTRILSLFAFLAIASWRSLAAGQDESSATPDASPPTATAEGATDADAANAGLPLAQEQVLRKYQRFEEVLLRMSELTTATDPKRAALLRKAVGQSKDKLISAQFDKLVELVRRDQLATAVANQKDVEKDLKQLLDLLLSEQRGDRLKDERQRIKEQIRRLNELINKQQQLEGQAQGGADLKKLAPNQGKLGEQTHKLADDMQAAANAEKQQNQRAQADDDDAEQGDGKKDKQAGEKSDREKSDDQSAEPDDKFSESEKGEPKKSSDADSTRDKPAKDTQPSGEQPESEKAEGEKAEGEKSEGEKSEGEPSQSQQSQGEKSSKQQPRGKQGKQSQSDQPPSDQSESPEEPPPSDSDAARQRVREAEQAMDDARKKLEQAKRDGAAADQEQARRKLEEAKAKLEEVLRQLREEEVERGLALLEARFRKMLQMETEVHEGTVRLDRVKPEDRTHNEEIEAGRLGRQQQAILGELSAAETLLHEDGTSVAFPEAVQELREDMEQVAARLAEAKVDQVTQLTEQDIITALEEMIAAFQKAQQENEERKQRQQPQEAGERQEPPLVDAIAELKMIRALQMRVNKRTESFSKLVEGEEGQAEKAELVEALEKLSQREQRIYRTTRDIVLGKNQ